MKITEKKKASRLPARIATGVPGLDDILNGGLPSSRTYLLLGATGSGKTTLALQFALEGIRRGEKVLYVTLSETESELQEVAASHGWDIDSVDIFVLSQPEQEALTHDKYTLFHPSEVELTNKMKILIEKLDEVKPQRAVIDPISELRLLERDPLRHRRQLSALKWYFDQRNCTVFFLDDLLGDVITFPSLVHGIIELQQTVGNYGEDRRQIFVRKLRGMTYKSGLHDFRIITGGLRVFPRMIASHHIRDFNPEPVCSGVEELDALLGGGLNQGTSTLILGPAGTGKSTLSMQYAAAAAERGQKVQIIVFDETMATFFLRWKGIGGDIQPLLESGKIAVQKVDPSEMTAGELNFQLRKSVAEEGVSMVIIDSLNGLIHAMPEQNFMELHIHAMLTYLNNQGVTTLMVMAQHGIMMNTMSPVDLSYLADTVLLLRFFEAAGEVRRAISVIKKRTGKHGHFIRELQISDRGVTVGEPLKQFRGVLTGSPEFTGTLEGFQSEDRD